MEMLSNFSLILGFDLWHTLISWFGSWITNYGWAIIVFTIALKLVMSPLDIYQRISTKKQQKYNAVMQPELQAIQAKYANDKEKLNQETAKVYKKYNFNVGGMCLSMLITMGLSMVVFFTLYSSLRSFGTEKLYDSYKELDTTYVQTVESESYATLTDDEKATTLKIAIEQKYEDLSKQNSWLWVKNVWKKDTSESQFVEFDDYAKHMGFDETEKTDAKARYDYIVKTIDGEEADANGYYVLIILAVAVSFLTQWLSTKISMPKGQKLNTMNKVMMAVIPITMAILASTSNVVFTLYIIANSVMSAIISTILAYTMKPKGGKEEDVVLPKKNVEVVEYSRNNLNFRNKGEK
ncbi:MAG: membrane protein insertase YidC [Clostridia bacterium]|nr:membrane protein insertase YidC [Clostridia bacterium]